MAPSPAATALEAASDAPAGAPPLAAFDTPAAIQALGPLPSIAESIAALPWFLHAAVAIVGVAGLVLWACGSRVLRGVCIAVAAGFGTFAGLVVASMWTGAAANSGLAAAVGGAGGFLVGALVAHLLYRFAVALLFGGVMAVGCVVAFLAAANLGWDPHSVASPLFPAVAGVATDAEPDWADWPGGGGSGPTPAAGAAARRAEVDRVRNFLDSVTSEAQARWGSTPAPRRIAAALAGAIGLFVGVVAGLLQPAWAASALSSLIGAALWLPASLWGAKAVGVPVETWADLSSSAWLGVWLVAAAAGLGVQTVLRRRAAPRPRKPRAPAAETAGE